jgi:Nitrile hydratase beta subunit
MSQDNHPNKRPHDMGGEMPGKDGGPIDTHDHGMKFWEKQANALRNSLTHAKVVRLDEMRRAAEDLGERYYELEYFERTTHALRVVLLEKGFFTEGELKAKMAEVRKRYDFGERGRK